MTNKLSAPGGLIIHVFCFVCMLYGRVRGLASDSLYKHTILARVHRLICLDLWETLDPNDVSNTSWFQIVIKWFKEG